MSGAQSLLVLADGCTASSLIAALRARNGARSTAVLITGSHSISISSKARNNVLIARVSSEV